MTITLSQILVWIVVGALAGSLAAMLVKRQRTGFGRSTNLAIGIAGALIGETLFRLFKIDLGLREIAFTLEDLVAAFLGSLLLLGAVWLIRRQRKAGAQE